MESGGNFEDYKLVYIRFLSCHLFGPVNHGQTWKGWERSGEKGFIITINDTDNQAQTWLIITINDTSIGDLPLIITISNTCKNQPKTLDFDNTINLSSLIVSLALTSRESFHIMDIGEEPPVPDDLMLETVRADPWWQTVESHLTWKKQLLEDIQNNETAEGK